MGQETEQSHAFLNSLWTVVVDGGWKRNLSSKRGASALREGHLF